MLFGLSPCGADAAEGLDCSLDFRNRMEGTVLVAMSSQSASCSSGVFRIEK